MTITFKCQHCGKALSVAKDMADKAVRCECGKWVIAHKSRGGIFGAMSRAFHPIELGKSVLGKKGEPAEEAPEPDEEEVTPAPLKHLYVDKSLLVISAPEGKADHDWGALISRHVMSGEVDELTAYAYTRQAKEAHDDERYAEAFDLFESARDCYGQYCNVLVERATAGGPEQAGENEKVLADLEKCMYNFAVLICQTRIPAAGEPVRARGMTRLLLEELALAAKILQRPSGFWKCGVVFQRNKEQLVAAISECFERYELDLADFVGR